MNEKIENKECCHCGESKLIDEFVYKNGNQCKSCRDIFKQRCYSGDKNQFCNYCKKRRNLVKNSIYCLACDIRINTLKQCNKCLGIYPLIKFHTYVKNTKSQSNLCENCHQIRKKKAKEPQTCHSCNILKPKKNFKRNCSICNECKLISKTIKEQRLKKCQECKEIKPLDEFNKLYKNSERYVPYCRPCYKKRRLESDTIQKRKIRSEKRRKERRDKPIHSLFLDARRRAKKKKLPFNLNEETLSIPEKCPVLGITLGRNGDNKFPLPNSPSLDKVIPTLGYIDGNVNVISFRANDVKKDATAEEHERIAFYIRSNSPIEDYSI